MKFFFSMKISELHKIFLKFPKVTTDSRNVFKDSLFFALKEKISTEMNMLLMLSKRVVNMQLLMRKNII